MLSLFRTNQFVANVLLIFYAAICRFSIFITGVEITHPNPGVLSQQLYNVLGNNIVLINLLAILLVIFQATGINIIVSKYRMDREISLLPGVFYVLLCSSIPEFLSMSPPLLANTFYIIAILQIFDAYKKYSVATTVFNTGLWLAIGSLFYFSFVTFLIWAFIVFPLIRSSKIKENLILIIGFGVPYFLINVIYFWNDQLADLWQNQILGTSGFLDLYAQNLNYELYIKLAFFFFLILFAMFNAASFGFKKSTQIRKYISILFWGLLFAAIATLFQGQVSLQHLLLLCPPLAIFLSFSFIKMNKSMAESLHLLLLFLILILQFKPLWMPM